MLLTAPTPAEKIESQQQQEQIIVITQPPPASSESIDNAPPIQQVTPPSSKKSRDHAVVSTPPSGVSIAFVRWFIRCHVASESSPLSSTPSSTNSVHEPDVPIAPTTADVFLSTVKPLAEAHPSGTLVDYFQRRDNRQADPNEDYVALFGPATVVVSHAWLAPFADLVDVLEQHADGRERETYFWIDLFCVNQSSSQELSVDSLHTLTDFVLRAIGKLLVVATPWHAPIFASRTWCCWEIGAFLARLNASSVAFKTPQTQHQLMHATFANPSQAISEMLPLDQWTPTSTDASKHSDRDALLSHLTRLFGDTDKAAHAIRRQFMLWRHALFTDMMTRIASSSQASDVVTSQLFDVATALMQLDMNDAAIEYLNRAIQICQRSPGETGLQQARLHHSLGTVHVNTGSSFRAHECFLKAADIYDRLADAPKQEALKNLLKLASTSEETAKLPMAVQSYKKAVLVMDDSSSFDIEYKLAVACIRNGDRDDAVNHFASVVRRSETATDAPQKTVADAYRQLAYIQLNLKQYDAASQHFESAIKMQSTVDDLELVSEMHTGLGLCHNEKGNFARAVECFQQALNMQNKAVKGGNVATAAIWAHLGSAFASQGENILATECYQQALLIRRSLGSAADIVTASILSSLGALYEKRNKLMDALDFFEKALHARIDILGDEHLDVARCWLQCADVNAALGHFNEALEQYIHALRIQYAVLGEHILTATTLFRLGKTQFAMRTFEVARESWSQCLEIQLKTLGSSHPDVAGSHLFLGKACLAQGYTAQAAGHFRKALDIRSQTAVASSLEDAELQDCLGQCQQLDAKYGAALESFTKSHSLRVKELGSHHSLVATSFHLLGCCHHASGDFKKAFSCLQQALDMRTALFGQVNIHVASTQSALARSLAKLRRNEAANDLAALSISVLQRLHGDTEMIVAEALAAQAFVLGEWGQYPAAVAKQEAALEAFRHACGEPHYATAMAEADLATLLIRTGSMERAQELLFHAYTSLRAGLDAQHPRCLELTRRLRDAGVAV